MAKKDYDSTVARIAGNLLSGVMANRIAGVNAEGWINSSEVVQAVAEARRIVAEVQRTEPREETP